MFYLVGFLSSVSLLVKTYQLLFGNEPQHDEN